MVEITIEEFSELQSERERLRDRCAKLEARNTELERYLAMASERLRAMREMYGAKRVPVVIIPDNGI